MAKKVLSLDNLKVIKSYIDDTKNNLSQEIDTSTKEYINSELDEARESIKEDYENKLKELEDKLAEAIKNGNADEIEDIKPTCR